MELKLNLIFLSLILSNNEIKQRLNGMSFISANGNNGNFNNAISGIKSEILNLNVINNNNNNNNDDNDIEQRKNEDNFDINNRSVNKEKIKIRKKFTIRFQVGDNE